jgi:nicotinamide/nicotinate riboside kinase
VDWDCPEAINIADMEKALTHIRSEGIFPVSKTRSVTVCQNRHCVTKTISLLSDNAIKSTTYLPESSVSRVQPFVDSKEDQNSVGSCPASDDQISVMKAKVQAWLQPGQPGHDIFKGGSPLRMCLLDGFLLYSPPDFSKIMDLIDIKFFLCSTCHPSKAVMTSPAAQISVFSKSKSVNVSLADGC